MGSHSGSKPLDVSGAEPETPVERPSRFLILLALIQSKDAVGVADALIPRVNDLPRHIRGGLACDQGSDMARHAHPRSPWERPSNENTNGLIGQRPRCF